MTAKPTEQTDNAKAMTAKKAKAAKHAKSAKNAKNAKKRNHVGRPTAMTNEVQERILTHLSEGKTITSLKQRDDVPSLVTIYNYVFKDDEFLKKFELARGFQASSYVDEGVDIADGITQSHEKDRVRIAEVRISARHKAAAYIVPDRFSQQKLVVSGDKDSPVVLKLQDLSRYSDEELEAMERVARIVEEAKGKLIEHD